MKIGRISLVFALVWGVNFTIRGFAALGAAIFLITLLRANLPFNPGWAVMYAWLAAVLLTSIFNLEIER